MHTDSVILSLYFETPLHAPSGSVLGLIDAPIQRERTTQWPMVYAASLENALRASFVQAAGENTARGLFDAAEGAEAQAPALSVGDARLLLFPVRSSAAPFLWITCPAILSRLRRDVARTLGWNPSAAPVLKPDEIVTAQEWRHGQDALAVEDIVVRPRNGLHAEDLLKLVPSVDPAYDGFAREVEGSLGVVADEVFGFLVRTATEVHASRSRADDDALLYEEVVPADALFYAPIWSTAEKPKGRKKDASPLQVFGKHLASHLRVGEGEVVGRGWARTWLLSPQPQGGAQ